MAKKQGFFGIFAKPEYNIGMQPDELKRAPKLFAENIKIAYTPEYFVMGMSSGEQAQIYSLTPAHAKRLKLYLEHELKEYEKQFGTIDTDWNPHVQSPIQPGNPPGQGS